MHSSKNMAATALRLSVTNCFLLPVGGKFVLIDTGYDWEWPAFQTKLKRSGIAFGDITHVILTHHHDDHAGLLNFVVERNPSVAVVMSIHARDLLAKGHNDHSRGGGYVNRRVNFLLRLKAALDKKWTHTFPPYAVRANDILIEKPTSLRETGIALAGSILLTPGHSTDSISVVLEDGDSYIGDAAAKFLRFAGTKYCIIYIEDLDQYYASWRQLIQSGATRLNPAHGKPFGIEKLAKYIGRNRARNMVQVP